MTYAPIIVFAYNRADHLAQTLEALSKNELAELSILYIFCDGPKENASAEQLRRISEVRALAHKQNWAKQTLVFEQNKNIGLGSSIIAGVTKVINEYGKAIIVEDDLVTSPFFLTYMNQCLDHYEDRKTVYSINALSRPHPERFFPDDYPYDVYVGLTNRPWGWATWKDRWQQVDWSAKAYKTIKNNPQMINAFNRLGADYFEALQRQQETGQNVWSIRFALTHFVNNAVSINPIVSYATNIGWGEDSTNTTGSGAGWRHEKLCDKKEIKFVDILYLDSRIINSWYSFSVAKPRSLWGKLKNWYGRVFLNRDEFALKGRVFDV